MTDKKKFDLAKTGGMVTAVMAAFAVAGSVFGGPFGAAIGAGIGAIIAGVAIIINAVKNKKDAEK